MGSSLQFEASCRGYHRGRRNPCGALPANAGSATGIRSEAPGEEVAEAQEKPVKTITIFVLFGAILGAAAASLIVPPALSWYNEAGFVSRGSQVQALVNVPEVVRYTTSRLIRGQLIGAGIGAITFLVFGLLVVRRGQPRAPLSPPNLPQA
jgi:hypothetical protein